MRQLATILFFLIFSSCIPLRNAPNIEGEKIMVAKKFKRKLPSDYAFIFEDTKEADDFYNYINLKYELNDNNVDRNVPFTINHEKYFLSFYETSIPTKKLVLGAFLMGIGVEMAGGTSDVEIEVVRKDTWYIALTVLDSNLEDCLESNHNFRTEVISYLRELKQEYLKGNYSVVSN